jgi:hypothetical protein
MRRYTRGLALTAVAALHFGGALEGVAAASPTVNAGLYQSNGKQRLIVSVSQRQPFTDRNRPRSVAVRYARASYRLRDVTPGTRAQRKRLAVSLWQNESRAAEAVKRLAGKRVVVTVRTAAGTTTFRRTVTPPPVIFDQPSRTYRGEEAFRRIKQYFVNSRFTNCPDGWPHCNTELQINHCAGGDLTGGWQRREFPPSLTSDVSGSYRITGAFQGPGSWGVTYVVTLASGQTGTFSWAVLSDGRASGVYELGEESGQLTRFRWQPSAGC